jgi:hypothetical protein
LRHSSLRHLSLKSEGLEDKSHDIHDRLRATEAQRDKLALEVEHLESKLNAANKALIIIFKKWHWFLSLEIRQSFTTHNPQHRFSVGLAVGSFCCRAWCHACACACAGVPIYIIPEES